jgi:two-component system, chemotaxis family, sensor kinase Cph1
MDPAPNKGRSSTGASRELAAAEMLVRDADSRISESLDQVAALLGDQSRLCEPKVRSELEDAQRRIVVIGKLHKLLSLSDNVGSVALDEYLHSIGDELAVALAASSRTLLINVDGLILPARLARAIGLTVHEFIVSALRHVIGDGAGVVQVACGTNRDGSLTLEVSDDGFANKETSRCLGKLGTPLVSGLVSQLGASMKVENAQPGLRCTFVIPANAAL